MRDCRLCRSPDLRFVTDFGDLAVTNQFIMPGGPVPFRQSLSWHSCLTCGVVQLTETLPLEQIRSRFPWLTYREPEGHLDETALDLVRVGNLQTNHRIFGLTQEDVSLLRRLAPLHFQILDPREDLGITEKQYGMETIQASWTVECAHRVVESYGKADVLVARYALEHAHNAAEFLAACRVFLAPEGILLIEVPDCSQAFQDVDVTAVWEEHVLYLTEQTLDRGLVLAGFQRLYFQRVHDIIEDRLIWIGRSAESPDCRITDSAKLVIDSDVEHFAQGWPMRRDAFRSWAQEIKAGGGKLALFGGGHRACTLVDAMALTEFLDCVIDDSVEKQKLRFPAGALPIFGSAALLDRDVTCCLLAVNPNVEERIVNRNSEFVAQGGNFVSCYPRSPRALRFS